MASNCRQNYHQDCEAAINKQINMELYASYVYLSMSYYFSRDDVALPGFAKFFKHASDEEREHAQIMMTFQNDRGGRIVLQNLTKPEKDEWGTGLDAMETALALEKTVNLCLIDIHKLAEERNDPHMCDWLEDKFLREMVEAEKQLADYISQLRRCGPGLGEYLFDKETLQDAKVAMGPH